MAKLEGNILFTGSLGNVSAYRLQQSGTIVLRAKGGASKKKIRNAPEFINTRRNNEEFGRCSTAAAAIKHVLSPLRQIPNQNLVSAFCSLCRKILVLDQEHDWGQREVYFSPHPHLLSGFNLSTRDSYDSVVVSPLVYTFDPGTAAVTIDVPALLPGANLRLPGSFPFYRLVFSLGLLPDTASKPKALPVQAMYGEWTRSGVGQPAQAYQLKLPDYGALAPGHNLLIGAGIEMSVNGREAVRHAGAGKILALIAGEKL